MGNVTKLHSVPFYEFYSILLLGFTAEINNLMQLWGFYYYQE